MFPWDAYSRNNDNNYSVSDTRLMVEVKYNDKDFEASWNTPDRSGSFTVNGGSESGMRSHNYGGSSNANNNEKSSSGFTDFANNTLWSTTAKWDLR